RRVSAGHSAVWDDLCDDRCVRPTVLIVDDHDGFRESARALLEAEGFAVVGDAADGAAALAAALRLRPGVVLLGVQLPDVDGFAVAEGLAALSGTPRVGLNSRRDAGGCGPRPCRDAARRVPAEPGAVGCVAGRAGRLSRPGGGRGCCCGRLPRSWASRRSCACMGGRTRATGPLTC